MFDLEKIKEMAKDGADTAIFEKLEQLRQSGIERIKATSIPEDLQLVRANLLGKKGEVTEILKSVGKASPELSFSHRGRSRHHTSGHSSLPRRTSPDHTDVL